MSNMCKICGEIRPLNQEGICESCYNALNEKDSKEPENMPLNSYNRVHMYHASRFSNSYKKVIGVWLIVIGSFVTLLLWIASAGLAGASIGMQSIQSVTGSNVMVEFYNNMGDSMGAFGIVTFALSLLILFGCISGGVALIRQSKI